MTTTTNTTKTLTAGIAAITTARRLTKQAFEEASFAAGSLGLDTDTEANRGNPSKPADIERALKAAHSAAERATANLAHALGLPKPDAPAPMTDAEILDRAGEIVRERNPSNATDVCNALQWCARQAAPACTVSDILGGGR